MQDAGVYAITNDGLRITIFCCLHIYTDLIFVLQNAPPCVNNVNNLRSAHFILAGYA
jgi:hypothetical protein